MHLLCVVPSPHTHSRTRCCQLNHLAKQHSTELELSAATTDGHLQDCFNLLAAQYPDIAACAAAAVHAIQQAAAPAAEAVQEDEELVAAAEDLPAGEQPGAAAEEKQAIVGAAAQAAQEQMPPAAAAAATPGGQPDAGNILWSAADLAVLAEFATRVQGLVEAGRVVRIGDIARNRKGLQVPHIVFQQEEQSGLSLEVIVQSIPNLTWLHDDDGVRLVYAPSVN